MISRQKPGSRHGQRARDRASAIVDYVQNEEKVEVGEMFYTSGDDRIFPKGMPVGQATVVRAGKTFKEIFVVPTGFQHGLEEVLIVIQGEHQPIPEQQEATVSSNVYLMKAPQTVAPTSNLPDVLVTDADKLREQYKSVGDAQGHQFGEGGPGAKPPNFNLRVEVPKPTQPTPTCGSRDYGNGTNPAPAVAKPRPVTAPQIGPDGQPIAPQADDSRASRRDFREPNEPTADRRQAETCRCTADRTGWTADRPETDGSGASRPDFREPNEPDRRRSPSRNLLLRRRSDRMDSRSLRGQRQRRRLPLRQRTKRTQHRPSLSRNPLLPRRSDRTGSRSLRGQRQRRRLPLRQRTKRTHRRLRLSRRPRSLLSR